MVIEFAGQLPQSLIVFRHFYYRTFSIRYHAGGDHLECLFADPHAAGGFAAQCDFGSIHPEHPRIAARRRVPPGHDGSWHEAQFHQAGREFIGKVDAIEHRLFAVREIGEGSLRASGLVATQLHLASSM